MLPSKSVYERLWWVFKILELLFQKRLKLIKKGLMEKKFEILLVLAPAPKRIHFTLLSCK